MDADAVAAHHRVDPEVMVRCSDLRALHLALCLIAFRDDFGDLDDWDQNIRSFLGMIGVDEPCPLGLVVALDVRASHAEGVDLVGDHAGDPAYRLP